MPSWRALVPAIAALLLGVALVLLDGDLAQRLRRAAGDLLGRRAEAPPTIYKVFSEDPLVVYIQDFITAKEAAHLVALAFVLFSFYSLFGSSTENLVC